MQGTGKRCCAPPRDRLRCPIIVRSLSARPCEGEAALCGQVFRDPIEPGYATKALCAAIVVARVGQPVVREGVKWPPGGYQRIPDGRVVAHASAALW